MVGTGSGVVSALLSWEFGLRGALEVQLHQEKRRGCVTANPMFVGNKVSFINIAYKQGTSFQLLKSNSGERRGPSGSVIAPKMPTALPPHQSGTTITAVSRALPRAFLLDPPPCDTVLLILLLLRSSFLLPRTIIGALNAAITIIRVRTAAAETDGRRCTTSTDKQRASHCRSRKGQRDGCQMAIA